MLFQKKAKSKMMIGIDFSINSTAIVFQNDLHFWISVFIPNYENGKKTFQTHDMLSECVRICSYSKKNVLDKKKEDAIKMENANNLSSCILEEIKKRVMELDCTIDKIFMEGYSFGSKGNAFLDLVMFNSFLRLKLIQEFGQILQIVSPKSVKKHFCGNGNASKCDMIRHFLEQEQNSCTKQILKNIVKDIIQDKEKSTFKIPKPIDDIVDAIAVIQFHERM